MPGSWYKEHKWIILMRERVSNMQSNQDDTMYRNNEIPNRKWREKNMTLRYIFWSQILLTDLTTVMIFAWNHALGSYLQYCASTLLLLHTLGCQGWKTGCTKVTELLCWGLWREPKGTSCPNHTELVGASKSLETNYTKSTMACSEGASTISTFTSLL